MMSQADCKEFSSFQFEKMLLQRLVRIDAILDSGK
jgi:hypothetical protein